MATGESPDLRDVWDVVNQSRLELAELRGMITMHFREGEHHHPPCKPAADMQKTMLSALGAAVLALIAAVGSIVMELLKR
ncbi:MAG: hypothetical protein ACI4RV_05095 [Eubacteriales bacterium]